MKYYQIMASSDYQKYSCSFYHANILFCMNQIMASVGYQKCTAKLKVQYQLFRCKIKLGKFIPCSRPLSTVLVSQSKASTGSFLHQAHMHTQVLLTETMHIGSAVDSSIQGIKMITIVS